MEYKIAVIGLGYVGLPLAVEFGKKYETVGFDIHKKRIEELKSGHDRTYEVEDVELKNIPYLSYTYNIDDIKNSNIYIVTVPTPIDIYKKPDLTPLMKASEMLSGIIKQGDIVIYESTVFPGCTEEVCVPILEKAGLKFNTDFFCGYSPERINPGDKEHRLPTIKKVTSGSTPKIADIVDSLYASVITAGTHKASSMKVAEAAKAIENAQRDINIAFVNELSLIFDRVGIDTLEVLEAAGTKWNFLPFRPGLVGGHCIGVDPYYLTYKAESLGYHPEIILSGRRINDNMSLFVTNKLIKLMIKNSFKIEGAKVLVLGVTFKENCPDIRNSKVVDIIYELQDFGCNVSVYDPEADVAEVRQEYGIELECSLEGKKFESILLAVNHKEFMSLDIDTLKEPNAVVYDIKGVLPKDSVDARL
ncbi:MAG: nucleotide sugar dehydrogenase [Campylobacterales bacterium]